MDSKKYINSLAFFINIRINWSYVHFLINLLDNWILDLPALTQFLVSLHFWLCSISWLLTNLVFNWATLMSQNFLDLVTVACIPSSQWPYILHLSIYKEFWKFSWMVDDNWIGQAISFKQSLIEIYGQGFSV